MKLTIAGIAAIAAIVLAPAATAQETAAEILQTMQEREMARMRGVDGFYMRESSSVPYAPDAFHYYEAVKGKGNKTVGYRLVDAGEVAQEIMNRSGPTLEIGEVGFGAGDLWVAGGKIMYSITGEVVQIVAELEAERHGRELNVVERLFLQKYDNGWDRMAESVDKALEERNRAAETIRSGPKDAERFAAQADFMNAISAEGHEAYFLFNDNVNETQRVDGVDYTINSIGLLIDKQRHVALGMRVDGVARQKKKSEPFFIQRIDRKHRFLKNINGANTQMLIPHEVEMTIGLPPLDDKERRKLAKAKKDLADALENQEEFRQQLEALPLGQQAQIAEMVKRRLEEAELRISMLESASMAQVTKTVIDARAGSIEDYQNWLKEQVQNDGALPVSDGTAGAASN